MRPLRCLALNSDVSDRAGHCNLDKEVFSTATWSWFCVWERAVTRAGN